MTKDVLDGAELVEVNDFIRAYLTAPEGTLFSAGLAVFQGLDPADTAYVAVRIGSVATTMLPDQARDTADRLERSMPGFAKEPWAENLPSLINWLRTAAAEAETWGAGADSGPH